MNGPTSVKSDRVGAVRRLASRSFRSKVERFLVEGPQAVREAVGHRPEAIDEIFLADDATPAVHAVAQRARDAGVLVTQVPERVLLAMTETVHPQGIAAVCRFVDRPAGSLLDTARLVVVLHEVRDPGNAGTILRTADAAGADAVIFSGDAVDPYNGKCVRSTAGSLFHVPVALVADLAGLSTALRAAGLRVLGTSGTGAERLTDPAVADRLRHRVAWVFGNEAHGLPESAEVDQLVAIPMFGAAESLNLAAAAAVCLFTTAFAQNAAGAPLVDARVDH